MPSTKPQESYQLDADACSSPSPPYLPRVVTGPRSKVLPNRYILMQINLEGMGKNEEAMQMLATHISLS